MNGGDSASSYRHWRNGAPHSRKKGEEDGRRSWNFRQRQLFPRRPSSSPVVSYGGAHHSAANVVSERNLQQKITKTLQQMQQKELAKLEYLIYGDKSIVQKQIRFRQAHRSLCKRADVETRTWHLYSWGGWRCGGHSWVKSPQGYYVEVQVKAVSEEAWFAGISHQLRKNYWFVFYSESMDTFWLFFSSDFLKEACANKAGTNIGKYSIKLDGTRKGVHYPLSKYQKYITSDFTRII